MEFKWYEEFAQADYSLLAHLLMTNTIDYQLGLLLTSLN